MSNRPQGCVDSGDSLVSDRDADRDRHGLASVHTWVCRLWGKTACTNAPSGEMQAASKFNAAIDGMLQMPLPERWTIYPLRIVRIKMMKDSRQHSEGAYWSWRTEEPGQ